MKLMEYQVKLEEKYRKTFMDLSLSDTIYQVRSVTHSTVLAFTVDWGRLTDHLPLPQVNINPYFLVRDKL